MRFFPLGQRALTVEFGTEVSEELNDLSIALAAAFEASPFPGMIEAVPAFVSLTLHYDPNQVLATNPESVTSFDAVIQLIENMLGDLFRAERPAKPAIEIPVDFGERYSLDLRHVAEVSGISPPEVITIFTDTIYRVYMLGFLPGFPYMGQVDERIAIPRKKTPRVSVPSGSVGIAGRQTGIYPFESPGGWQIIGRTEIRLFTRENETPCLFTPGDRVKFTAV